MLRAEEVPSPVITSGHTVAVDQVLAVMRNHADGSLDLRAMAEIACLSPYHFARVFRRITGIPPGEFHATLRLEHAKTLLLTTDLGVTDVCYEVGYNSLGTFTTRFTQLVGLSPGRMRALPERVCAIWDRLGEQDRLQLSPPPAGAGLVGSVHAPDLDSGLIFVGLFRSAVPQGRPVAGTILTAPGAYTLNPLPDGRYHLLAASLPLVAGPFAALLPGERLRVGRAESPLLVRAGRIVSGSAQVSLRPARATDPPVLVSLLSLLLKRLAPSPSAG